MAKTVQEIIALLSAKEAPEVEGEEKVAMSGVGSEAQSPVGAAAAANAEAKRALQVAAKVPMDVNTDQQTAGIPGAAREAVKTRIMSMEGEQARAQADSDPEAELNYGQDLDASGATAVNQGPVGAEQKMGADSTQLLADLRELLEKNASEEDVEMLKMAEDATAMGRWMARGFWDELSCLSSEAPQAGE